MAQTMKGWTLSTGRLTLMISDLSSGHLVQGGRAVQKNLFPPSGYLAIERERIKCINDKQSLNCIKMTHLS